MIPFRYKPEPPHGSPDHDGEAEPGKSFDEELDKYYLYAEEYEEHLNEVIQEY